DHLVDDLAAFLGLVVLGLGQHDLDLVVMRQIVQRGHDPPAVHLRLVDLLGAVIEARGIAQTNGVGRGEQPECRVRTDDAALVSSVGRPRDSSTRWITNITSGRPASYSSKHSATLFW